MWRQETITLDLEIEQEVAIGIINIKPETIKASVRYPGISLLLVPVCNGFRILFADQGKYATIVNINMRIAI